MAISGRFKVYHGIRRLDNDWLFMYSDTALVLHTWTARLPENRLVLTTQRIDSWEMLEGEVLREDFNDHKLFPFLQTVTGHFGTQRISPHDYLFIKGIQKTFLTKIFGRLFLHSKKHQVSYPLTYE